MTPQAAIILKHLIATGSISGIEAQGMYKARSLSRRITEIKAAGHMIHSSFRKDITGQRYVRYEYMGTATNPKFLTDDFGFQIAA